MQHRGLPCPVRGFQLRSSNSSFDLEKGHINQNQYKEEGSVSMSHETAQFRATEEENRGHWRAGPTQVPTYPGMLDCCPLFLPSEHLLASIPQLIKLDCAFETDSPRKAIFSQEKRHHCSCPEFQTILHSKGNRLCKVVKGKGFTRIQVLSKLFP